MQDRHIQDDDPICYKVGMQIYVMCVVPNNLTNNEVCFNWTNAFKLSVILLSYFNS